jgi:hypothetical protein
MGRLAMLAMISRAPSREVSRRYVFTQPRPEADMEHGKSYLGSPLGPCFLISGLSYKTTFSSEFRISIFPLYSI